MSNPILALDIGLRRTGLALSESGLIATPLGVIEWQPPHAHQMIREVIEHVRKYEIKILLVGVPFDEEDQPTSQSLKTENIITQIEETLQREKLEVKVERINEFHSTLDAIELFPGTDKDAAAAALLLQQYLEEHPPVW